MLTLDQSPLGRIRVSIDFLFYETGEMKEKLRAAQFAVVEASKETRIRKSNT